MAESCTPCLRPVTHTRRKPDVAVVLRSNDMRSNNLEWTPSFFFFRFPWSVDSRPIFPLPKSMQRKGNKGKIRKREKEFAGLLMAFYVGPGRPGSSSNRHSKCFTRHWPLISPSAPWLPWEIRIACEAGPPREAIRRIRRGSCATSMTTCRPSARYGIFHRSLLADGLNW